MAEGELLERIDEHMARGNELMARIIEITEDQREFTRDLLRRFEIVVRDVSLQMREMRAETAAGRQVLIDLHEDSLAQRQAIWTLIDELREHGLGGRG